MKSPTPTLPQGEGVMSSLRDFRKRLIQFPAPPSLWGRAGVGLIGLFCLILCGCIIEYTPTGIDEVVDILVVDGVVTDDESYITLSRSVSLTGEEDYSYSYYVNNAKVYVECDDNTQLAGFRVNDFGRYAINTGKLNPERQYRLKIVIDMIEYGSDYSYPIQTPEIDSIFWKKRGLGQPVMLYVATHDQEGKILYFRWSYKEDWEYHAEVYSNNYPFYCWRSDNNKELWLGSTEKTVFGRLNDMVMEISPWNRKLSVLYRINITQNVISKRAYDYFANIKKNAQQTGSIFSPIPSELRGNISCITDPGRPVIGYVDVSSTDKKQRLIPYNEGAYEDRFNWDCQTFTAEELKERYGDDIPDEYVIVNPMISPPTFAKLQCMDCTYYGGSPNQKPEDWPNNH